MVINYREGGYKLEGGAASEVIPPKKWGAGKALAILKVGGGGTKCFGVVLTLVLEVLTILEGGGAQKVSTL